MFDTGSGPRETRVEINNKSRRLFQLYRLATDFLNTSACSNSNKDTLRVSLVRGVHGPCISVRGPQQRHGSLTTGAPYEYLSFREPAVVHFLPYPRDYSTATTTRSYDGCRLVLFVRFTVYKEASTMRRWTRSGGGGGGNGRVRRWLRYWQRSRWTIKQQDGDDRPKNAAGRGGSLDLSRYRAC